MSPAIPKPTKAEHAIGRAARRDARRSSPVRNASGAAHPKPEVWHCAEYRSWAVRRHDCGIKGRKDHRCEPRVNGKTLKVAAHPEPEAKGLKASDHRIVVFCDLAHREQHQIGWQSFMAKYDFDRDAEARRIFESSPWFGKVAWP